MLFILNNIFFFKFKKYIQSNGKKCIVACLLNFTIKDMFVFSYLEICLTEVDMRVEMKDMNERELNVSSGRHRTGPRDRLGPGGARWWLTN